MTYGDTYALAHRLVGDHDDANDVAQEAYLRAYRAVKKFRGDAQFSTWLYRITANCAATHLGRLRRHRHDELTSESPIVDTNPHRDPELLTDAALLRDELSLALAGLPARLRSVVVLRDVHDLPHEAVARELGISETAAKVRLHRARRKLRDAMFAAPRDAESGDSEHAHAV